jgi:hypothetical protein
MDGKGRTRGRGRKGRSVAQRRWARAVGLASKAWEGLSDPQRLAWNAEGKRRRSTGQRYFTGINARRLRDGQALLTEVPAQKAYSGKPVLRRLVIGNRGGQITLKLEVAPAAGVRVTVWGSRPCNRGVSRSPKCPRLGDLPAAAGGASDITELYFRKHGEYIATSRLQMAGKRIFIRTRVEMEGGPGLWEGTNGVVPEPEGRGGRGKRG